MPDHVQQDHEVPLPPPSGPGSLRGRRIAHPLVMKDKHVDPRTQEDRLDRITEQAAATAVIIKVHDKKAP